MSGYHYSRCWYMFASKNGRRIKPIHHALIHWIFEKANISNWRSEFQLSTSEACEILGISDKNTYQKAFKDLVSFGAVNMVQEAKGTYSARWVSIETCEMYLVKNPVIETVVQTVEYPVKDTFEQPTIQPVETTPINKLNKTIETNKQINNKKDVDAIRVEVEEVFEDDDLEEKKIKKSPKVAQKGSFSTHTRLKEIIEEKNPGYYWQAKDGKALKSIIAKMSFRWKAKHGTNPTDEDLFTSFTWLLKNLPEWYQDKWDTSIIESKFESIVKQIIDNQNGNSKSGSKNTGPINTKRYSEILERINERSKEREERHSEAVN